MKLVFTVRAAPQGTAAERLTHVFETDGGVIGRGSACDWTLPDPTKTLSSRHAVISYHGGNFYVTDTSTNGVFVGSETTPLGRGRAAQLRPGSQLRLGPYSFAVSMLDEAAGGKEQPVRSGPKPVVGDPVDFIGKPVVADDDLLASVSTRPRRNQPSSSGLSPTPASSVTQLLGGQRSEQGGGGWPGLDFGAPGASSAAQPSGVPGGAAVDGRSGATPQTTQDAGLLSGVVPSSSSSSAPSSLPAGFDPLAGLTSDMSGVGAGGSVGGRQPLPTTSTGGPAQPAGWPSAGSGSGALPRQADGLMERLEQDLLAPGVPATNPSPFPGTSASSAGVSASRVLDAIVPPMPGQAATPKTTGARSAASGASPAPTGAWPPATNAAPAASMTTPRPASGSVSLSAFLDDATDPGAPNRPATGAPGVAGSRPDGLSGAAVPKPIGSAGATDPSSGAASPPAARSPSPAQPQSTAQTPSVGAAAAPATTTGTSFIPEDLSLDDLLGGIASPAPPNSAPVNPDPGNRAPASAAHAAAAAAPLARTSAADASPPNPPAATAPSGAAIPIDALAAQAQTPPPGSQDPITDRASDPLPIPSDDPLADLVPASAMEGVLGAAGALPEPADVSFPTDLAGDTGGGAGSAGAEQAPDTEAVSAEPHPARTEELVALNTAGAPGAEAAAATTTTAPRALDPVSVLKQRTSFRQAERSGPTTTSRGRTARSQPLPPADAVEPGTEGGEVIDVLLRSMGLDPTTIDAERRAAVAGIVGSAVREAAEGLVQVLAARRQLKSEFRMDRTQLQASRNNPLKFFRTGDAALDQLFVKDAEGYLPLDEAVTEAFLDVKAHEIAAVEAMRDSVQAILDRLDPASLQAQESSTGFFGRGDGKGLWERYKSLHAQLSEDIETTSARIVGERFTDAYRKHVKRLREGRN